VVRAPRYAHGPTAKTLRHRRMQGRRRVPISTLDLVTSPGPEPAVFLLFCLLHVGYGGRRQRQLLVSSSAGETPRMCPALAEPACVCGSRRSPWKCVLPFGPAGGTPPATENRIGGVPLVDDELAAPFAATPRYLGSAPGHRFIFFRSRNVSRCPTPGLARVIGVERATVPGVPSVACMHHSAQMEG